MQISRRFRSPRVFAGLSAAGCRAPASENTRRFQKVCSAACVLRIPPRRGIESRLRHLSGRRYESPTIVRCEPKEIATPMPASGTKPSGRGGLLRAQPTPDAQPANRWGRKKAAARTPESFAPLGVTAPPRAPHESRRPVAACARSTHAPQVIALPRCAEGSSETHHRAFDKN